MGAAPEHHVTTSEYTTTDQIPEHHVTTSEYTTVHQVPEHHMATSTYNTVHQVPEHHVAYNHYTTAYNVPEQHVVTQAYNTVHQATTYSTHGVKVAHVKETPYTVTSTAYKAQSYKVPVTTVHTKTVEVPKSGYRRLLGDSNSGKVEDSSAESLVSGSHDASKDETITKGDATSKLDSANLLKTSGDYSGASDYKVISTKTVKIPQYHYKTVTHTAYKTVSKPYTVVSHLVCTPNVHVEYQCPYCTHSTNYVPSYGADWMGATYTPSQVYSAGFATHVYHHVYHPMGAVTTYNCDGDLKWSPSEAHGWEAQGHSDWKSQVKTAKVQSQTLAATAETTSHSANHSAVGAVVGVSVGVVALAVAAMFVLKRRATKQATDEHPMSIL